jgi:predicted ATP-grasp superfamily ATP-dependent carboligase
MAAPIYQWLDEPGTTPLSPGAVLLCSFPSAGLAPTVAAHFVVRSLNLPRVGIMDSPDSAPVAVIQSGRVHPPIRAYGRPDFGLVLSEFPPSVPSASAIAASIVDGAEARKCRLVICLEGAMPHPVEAGPQAPDESLWYILARTDPTVAAQFEKAGARVLEDGVIGGVTGAMLVAGMRRKIPVAAVLVSARSADGFPDHRAGAALIEMLDRLLPELKIDTGPLRTQAEAIERALRSAMRGSARPEIGVPSAPEGNEGSMYR